MGEDGTVVVVAINKSSTSITVLITIGGGTVPGSFTPWVTSASDDLASKSPVSVSGGSFIAELTGMSFTTFVGE